MALTDEPDTYYVAMGTVDGDPKLPSAYHIFVGSKAPWYQINDSADRYDEFPDELNAFTLVLMMHLEMGNQSVVQ